MMLKSVMPVLPCKAMQQSMQYSEAQRIIAPWYFFCGTDWVTVLKETESSYNKKFNSDHKSNNQQTLI